jgi:hypothetical protein
LPFCYISSSSTATIQTNNGKKSKKNATDEKRIVWGQNFLKNIQIEVVQFNQSVLAQFCAN